MRFFRLNNKYIIYLYIITILGIGTLYITVIVLDQHEIHLYFMAIFFKIGVL